MVIASMESSSPLVSIIIPVYNVEPYLRRCVDSIVHQTYANLEIVLIDDGSSDNCPQICDSYAAADPRVVAIHQANGGQSKARNVGLDLAKGEYIAFVDADDKVEDDYVEVLLQNALSHNADVVVSGYRIIEDHKSTPHVVPHEELLKTNINILRAFCKCLFQPSPCAKLYSAHFLSKNSLRFLEGAIYEDQLWCCAWAEKATRVWLGKNVMYHYIVREGSTMTAQSTDERFRLMSWERILSAEYEILSRRKEELGRAFDEFFMLKLDEFYRQAAKYKTPFKKSYLAALAATHKDLFYYRRRCAHWGKLLFAPICLLTWQLRCALLHSHYSHQQH